MPIPLTGFDITDAFTTSLGWKIDLTNAQNTLKAHLLVNNQTDTEFNLWGDGIVFLGNCPAWLTYARFMLPNIYSFVEFREVANLNVQGAPALYVNAMLYNSNEPLPEILPIAIVRQTDIARQQRTVAVPMGLSHFNAGRWSTGDPAIVVFQTVTISAAQIAARVAPVYLYYANIAPDAGVNTNGMAFSLELQWKDASNVNIGSAFSMAHGNVVANATTFTTVPWILAPVWPLGVLGQIPINAAKAALQMSYISGTRIAVQYTVAFWMDQSNLIGDGDIGTQALYNSAVPNANPYF